MLPPLPASNPTPLYRLRDSLYAADLLTAALVELDLFTYLASGSIAFETLCSSLNLAPRPADVAVTLFTAMGLVRKRDETLELTDLARDHPSEWVVRQL